MGMRAIDCEVISPPTPGGDDLRPRFGGAGGAFSNEHLDMISKVLDTWFRVPGTSIRFGLDGIVGFVPGVGDLLGGMASCVLILAAYFRGAPLITVARMVANIAIEVTAGAVPLLGNLFDIGFRANRRNYALLERSLETGRRNAWHDWIFMGVLAAVLIALAMLPFVLLTLVLRALWPGARWL